MQPLRGFGNVGADEAAFGHGGRLLAVAVRPLTSTHAALRLWDVRRPRQRPHTRESNTELIDAIGISRNGQTLAYGDDDGTVWLLDIGTLQPHRRLHGPSASVTALAFAPDGHTLASATGEKITLFDLRRRQPRSATLAGDQGTITDLAFSPDRKTLAAAGVDGSIALWDINKRTRLTRLSGDSAQLTALAFSLDGRTLAAGGTNGLVRLWDAHKHTQIGRPLDSGTGSIDDAAFAADGDTLVSASSNATLRLWDLRTHTQIGSALRDSNNAVLAVAISPDGHTLTSATDAGELVIREGTLWRDFDDLKATVCRLAPVDLTKPEWDKLAPGMPQQTACSN